MATTFSRAITRRAERLEAVATALNERRPPPHFPADEREVTGRAERRLLDAADSIVGENDSLAEQRDEFEAILRSMTEAVVVTGARGQVILLNGASRRIFALGAETDYRDRPFVELCRDPRLQEFVGRSMRLADNRVINAEILIQNPAPLYVSASAAPIRISRGAAWVFVFHDITQLKSYETQRADFMSNLTHELRTPLSALYGYAETLVHGVDDPETSTRFLGIIERQARRLARLIDDLVSLSDLERGLTPLKFEPLEAPQLLSEAAELMQEQAARRGVKLDVKSSPALPKFSGDRDRMHQVMLNLIDNAVKYTPREGRVTLEARTSPLTDGTGEKHGIALSVADTGEGIPAADIPRLTERFYRVDHARSRELGGTGLGLAIVKHIVQLHHGVLRIESKLREGTTVTVWIPTAQE
ncbi:MAG: ATP-binding protein [Candidatus Binatus sp.]|uniref:sensor histidine kinase n=1 Tax=Candidatus Binatus sp. TaxID=2811406 RepID=UPI0027281B86|nr:ATP-binding protein [Candidatus Binatus sp.]MDO8433447.1 ATP-binding protein [Candidatus Binatus sp.]